MNKKSQKGFSLIEVLIAMTILVIGILAVGGMQTTAVKNNAISRRITEASALAASQLEFLTTLPYNDPLLNDRNGDGTTGLDKTDAQADFNLTQGQYSISWNVALDSPISNTKNIRVIVTWTDGGKSRRVSFNCIKAPY
jgi:type IV pilus assembly protein PilV